MVYVNGVWKTYGNSNQVGIKERIVGKKNSRKESRFARNWVLCDIGFNVHSGHSLGIVGHNGTGKSTLLSLILGTIKADRGEINRKGSVGAMLELGSGCHPELTGRENIFLNGAILGLRIHEIHRNFDSIVNFSELGVAIDLPLRTYSSGMSARLAFSVLAHARRDILLIDEILAVGDASFQEKCISYLQDYKKQGGTLVVVSHDMETLKDLCSEGIWLDEGKMVSSGPIDALIQKYMDSIHSEDKFSINLQNKENAVTA